MFDVIREHKLIEPFINALLVEMGLNKYASVFDSAIEMSGGYILEVDGPEFLFLFLQATPEQIERAATRVITTASERTQD